jgi:RNA polymerase sigma-70 factor (ECF subfamily)
MSLQPLAHRPRERELRLVSGRDTVQPSAQDDEQLVRDFEAGKPNAGAALYDRLLPVVDATLCRILGRREHDHSDLIQSAFEQIVSTLMKRRYARGCTPVGWAATIACHVGLNALRARRRERAVIDRDSNPGGSSMPGRAAALNPEVQFGAREELDAVRNHLGEMANDRVVALLLAAMGYELTDIARLTNASVSAAQSRLSRARRELSARLHDTPSDPSLATYPRSRP